MGITFSVVTPCFNANNWIRLCVNSVADQEGVSVQHIVQDGGSTDGTAEYLLSEPRICAESKPDKGMYDAINQGWAKCTGEFVLHLNADEELLPGALDTVAKCFQQNPDVDVILAGTLICEPDGSLHCYRKPIHPPLDLLLTSHHPVPSCAVFYRRSSFAGRPWLYDPSFRLISDGLLMIDIVKDHRKMKTLSRYTSVFFITGSNIGLTESPTAVREYNYQLSLASKWQRRMRRMIRAKFILVKMLHGHYSQGPLQYDIYVPGITLSRTRMFAAKPSGVYRPERTRDITA